MKKVIKLDTYTIDEINRLIGHKEENIDILEKIDKTENGGIDAFYNATIKKSGIKTLLQTLTDSNSAFKLKQMGVALCWEYLKGLGYEVVKPDVHVCRLLGRISDCKRKNGVSEFDAIQICQDIGKKFNMPLAEVDTILWQFCAKGKFEICGEKPKCNVCAVTKNNCKAKS